MSSLSFRVDVRRWRVDAANARQRWTEREGRLVSARDERGRTGYGEASPLPGYSDESVADVDDALRGVAEIGRRPFDWHSDPESQIAERVAGLSSPAARFAVETALWDLYSQRRQLPLAVVWGADPDAWVATAVLVDPLTPSRWPAVPPAAIKVKVGRPGAWLDELAGLEALEHRYPTASVRVDANRSFGLAAADRLADLEALARRGLRLEFVEEPSDGAWPAPAPVPVALDESLRARDPGESLEGIAAVVLKPTILGGRAGIARWLGRGPKPVVSHTFEGPVAHAAAAAQALSTAPTVVAGLGPHPGLGAWTEGPPGHVGEDGRLRVPPQPGLGWPRGAT